MYNGKGYFEKNDLNAYSLNRPHREAQPRNGSFTVQFGGWGKDVSNCLPIVVDLELGLKK